MPLVQYEPKSIIKKQTIPKRVTRFKFKVGDLVRTSILKRTFEREYDEKFTRELFFISSRKIPQGLAIYTLKDYAGEEITGTFYEKELLKASESEFYKIDKVLREKKRSLCKLERVVEQVPVLDQNPRFEKVYISQR